MNDAEKDDDPAKLDKPDAEFSEADTDSAKSSDSEHSRSS